MKRSQVLCLSLIVMCSFVKFSFGELALNFLSTPANSDPNSCLLDLTYTFHANRVVFTVDQYIPNPVNRSCTYQDIVTAPIFYNMPFTPLNLNLQPPNSANPNRLRATFTFADMISQLGHSCYLQFATVQYTCKFKFAGINFYLDLWTFDNTTFDTTGANTGVLFPEIGSAMQSTMYGRNIWKANASFPHIIGRIEDGCGTWDNVINSLSTPFTVTGTDYLSNTFDLHDYLASAVQFRVIVLKNGVPPSAYDPVPLGGLPFANPGINNCTNTGITYGHFLQNLTYCANGCGISLGLYTITQQFVLITDGISTAPNLLRG